MSYWKFPPYVTVAEKRALAEKKIRKLKKKNPDLAPVIIEGRSLAKTWWGKSWNTNLERYADYSNRIERGRSYVRHLAVLDLRINKGVVDALVQGSRRKPYAVEIEIKALKKTNWKKITSACADKLESLQDLLTGRFPKDLSHLFMEKGSGLFPSPKEIKFSCSCPDWAYMCKHVAAVLYGIGARLDEDPSLFFVLRKVNMDDLIAKALKDTTKKYIQRADEIIHPVVAEADLGSVFGIDMEATPDFGKIISESVSNPASAAKSSKKSNPSKRSSKKKTYAVDEKTLILEWVKGEKGGINAAGLNEKTGIDIVKIRNVLYQACRNGSIRKVSRGLYGPLVRTPKKTSRRAADVILSIIKLHPNGVGVVALKVQSGFEENQLRNIVFRLFKAGKISRIRRGEYVAVQ